LTAAQWRMTATRASDHGSLSGLTKHRLTSAVDWTSALVICIVAVDGQSSASQLSSSIACGPYGLRAAMHFWIHSSISLLIHADELAPSLTGFGNSPFLMAS